MSGWKIVGVNDDSTECEVCGRVDLKSTVHLVLDNGSELRAGSSCAARKVGTTAAKMRGTIKAYRLRLEVARCNFPDWFRVSYGMSVEQFLRQNPTRRNIAEQRYRRYMRREGFKVT